MCIDLLTADRNEVIHVHLEVVSDVTEELYTQ